MTLAELDIYTLREMQVPSEEHVLPNFLGGRLSARLIDKRTNDSFGATIDRSLHAGLQSILLILDARSYREPDRSPRALRNLLGNDGQLYSLQAGERYEQVPRLSITEDSPKSITLRARGMSKDRVLESLTTRATRMGVDPGLIVAQAEATLVVTDTSSDAELRIPLPLGLWGAEEQRATAKVACNLLATFDRSLFLDKAFDAIRGFVRGETWHRSGSPVEVVRSPFPDLTRSFDHLVAIYGRGSGAPVDSFVVYFGELAFVLRLADRGPDCAICTSYRVDQLRRTHQRNDPRDLAREMPDFDAAAARPWDEAMQTVLAQVQAVTARALSFARTVKPLDAIILEEFELARMQQKLDLDGTLSSKISETFVKRLAARVAESLLPNIRSAADARRQQAPASADDEDDAEKTMQTSVSDYERH